MGESGGSDGRGGDVLAFWRAVELFSPQAVPKLDEERVYRVAEGSPLPWEEGHPLGRERIRGSLAWQHHVYLGVYSLDEAFADLREALSDRGGDEDGELPWAGHSALAAFAVAHDGRAILGSQTLSSCAWALSRAHAGGAGSRGWLDGFERAMRAFADGFDELLALAEDDREGAALEREGHSVGAILDRGLLGDIRGLVADLLGIAGGDCEDEDEDGVRRGGAIRDAVEIRVASRQIKRSNRYRAVERDFLNSFIARDLGKVADAVGRGDYGPALGRYLACGEAVEGGAGEGGAGEGGAVEGEEQGHIDVECSLDFVRTVLAPQFVAPGRWPRGVSQPADLGQQLALNTILNDEILGGLPGGQSGLLGVNGPPGTGKTTMLRDLIAALVVQRAQRLAELKKPSEAFRATPIKFRAGGRQRTVHRLLPDLTGFEMVLACATNAAAENVSVEIPLAQAIAPEWHGQIDYFSALATSMLGGGRPAGDGDDPGEAWAMVAARLGSLARCQAFATAFWFQQPGDGSAAGTGTQEEAAGAPEEATGAGVPEEGAEAPEETAGAPDAQGGLLYVLKQHTARPEDWKSAREDFRAALQKESAARERRHAYARLFAELDTCRGAGEQHASRATGILARIARWVRRNATRERQARKRTDELRRQIADAGERWDTLFPGSVFPGGRWAQDSQRARRELRAPWLDEDWDRAHTELFLAALQLHKAFVLASASRMQQSLGVAIDVIQGSGSSEVPADAALAAWQCLFLLIPVISTTFASYPRLFRHLGREDLGWLFVDEAAQSTPQNAAGPIWRSRRAIAVGDPLQLEPIVTLPLATQCDLQRAHGVPEALLPSHCSVQALADRATPLGTHRGGDGEIWVGSPLNVHRRCEQPMFAIVNQIAYHDQMISHTPARGEIALPPSAWLHVAGERSQGHWIPEEGQRIEQLLAELASCGADFAEVFLISPFRDIAGRLGRYRTPYPGITTGTIHTTQGKEADVIVLVLGGDPHRTGDKRWAAQRPNLLNVAVSRARRRLYVIGNRGDWGGLAYFETLAGGLGGSLGDRCGAVG